MIVGVTGGIAAGKSTVMRMLRDEGAITFSADDAARAVLTPGCEALKEIAQTFGRSVLNAAGELDRSALGRIVFSDALAREQLNRIMHPRIRRLLSDQIRSAQEDFPPETVIAVEIPLLYEGKLQNWFERIIVVTASLDVQTFRLQTQSHLTEQQAMARIAAQAPIEDKVAAATYVVVNNGSKADLALQVEGLWHKLTNGRSNADFRA